MAPGQAKSFAISLFFLIVAASPGARANDSAA